VSWLRGVAATNFAALTQIQGYNGRRNGGTTDPGGYFG